MKQPDIAPVPPAAIRQSINSQEWIAVLEAWTAVVDLYIRLGDEDLAEVCKRAKFAKFVESFYIERASAASSDGTLKNEYANQLAHSCLTLVARCHEKAYMKSTLQSLTFLEAFAKCHARSAAAKELLHKIWTSYQNELEHELLKWQAATIIQLETVTSENALSSLAAIAPLMYICPGLAGSLLTGSDFIEAARTRYAGASNLHLRRALLLVVYLSLIGLIHIEHANTSLLSDHLYSLKSQADTESKSQSFLSDLVTETPLLKQIIQSTKISHERLAKIVASLRGYQATNAAKLRKNKHQKRSKGKQKVDVKHELHVHRMSLVTQLQDLFPDLGAGFVLRLLDAYDDNVEEITAHLLENTLKPGLDALDRHEAASIFDADQSHVVDNLAPRSTPTPPELFVPQRSNAFDNDEFDNLEIDVSKLHIGKKVDSTVTSSQSNKAAILAALAAFDSDDDERDDTYDAEDVGGMVDTAHHDGDDSISAPIDETDIKLYKQYEASQDSFGRTAQIRRSPGRAALKQATGMTDEAIEGWAIMLQREPKRARKLAFEASRFDGMQKEIARTAYREDHGTDTEDSDSAGTFGGQRGRGRGRGISRGGGPGRGGIASGATNEPGNAAAKRRKEANKSSRANHNRRDQRAKKMARGGFAGAS